MLKLNKIFFDKEYYLLNLKFLYLYNGYLIKNYKQTKIKLLKSSALFRRSCFLNQENKTVTIANQNQIIKTKHLEKSIYYEHKVHKNVLDFKLHTCLTFILSSFNKIYINKY